jgi:hypothetical protein
LRAFSVVAHKSVFTAKSVFHYGATGADPYLLIAQLQFRPFRLQPV